MEANLEDDFIKLNINIKNNVHKILDGINVLRLKNNPVHLNHQIIKNILLE